MQKKKKNANAKKNLQMQNRKHNTGEVFPQTLNLPYRSNIKQDFFAGHKYNLMVDMLPPFKGIKLSVRIPYKILKEAIIFRIHSYSHIR